MVLMAIDHASFFIARVHPAESWAYGPPYYASTTAFVTRWITHLCAPGFFFLMGAGMAMFAASRLDAGWSRRRVTRFLVTRGAILLVVQHLVENPAWLLGILSAAPELRELAPIPGDKGDIYANFAVITALGAGMIVWGTLIAAPSAVIGCISLAALVASMVVTPGPEHATVAYSFPVRISFIPGRSQFVGVLYPVVPWLVPAGLGILFARHITGRSSLLERRAALAGFCFIVAFIVLRTAGLGDYHPPAPGLIGFLTVTKYPPSLDFFALMLGIDLVLLALLARPLPSWGSTPLQVFGQVPLFFYLLHLYLFGVVSWLFSRGTSFGVMYAIWLAALVVMYPACRWYARFKGSKPVTSIWRLF